MPVPVGYAFKFPPGAQKVIQLDAAAPAKVLVPGNPASPKHGQPGVWLS